MRATYEDVVRTGAKACTECGDVKPLSEFHRNSHHKTGVASRCKVCAVRRERLRRAGTPVPRMVRTPKPPRRVHSLAHGEPWPEGEPKRYLNAEGYTRLRWKLEDRYVETYLRDDDGHLVRNRPPRGRRVDQGRAVDMYRSGMTQGEIGEALGFNPATLSRVLRRAGVNVRPAAALPFNEEEVLRMYEAKQGYSEIAKSLGVSSSRVKKVLVGRGIEIRGPGNHSGRPPNSDEITYQTEFKRMSLKVRERSGGRCEAMASPKCSGRGEHIHHRKLRSQGGKNDLATLMDMCQGCHMWTHGNPETAYEMGLLVRSWDEVKPYVPEYGEGV